MKEPKAPVVASNELLAELIKLRKKAMRLANDDRKRVGKDCTHFEGVCKGQWLAYSWAATRIGQIIKANPSRLGTGHLVDGTQHGVVGRSESKEPK